MGGIGAGDFAESPVADLEGFGQILSGNAFLNGSGGNHDRLSAQRLFARHRRLGNTDSRDVDLAVRNPGNLPLWTVNLTESCPNQIRMIVRQSGHHPNFSGFGGLERFPETNHVVIQGGAPGPLAIGDDATADAR